MVQHNNYEDHDAGGKSVPFREVLTYEDLPLHTNGQISLLFLCSESPERINACVSSAADDFVIGNLITHKKNIEDLKNLSNDDEVLKGTIKRSFIAGGNRAQRAFLSLAEEEHVIQVASDDRRHVSITKYFNVRKNELRNRLESGTFNVIHFCGHSDRKRGLALYPESSIDDKYLGKDELLADLKRLHNRVELAVFSTCCSDEIAKACVDDGVVDVAIGTSCKVADTKALEFVKIFYNELFGNRIVVGDKRMKRMIYDAFASAQSKTDRKIFSIFPQVHVIPLRKLHPKNTEYVDLLRVNNCEVGHLETSAFLSTNKVEALE